MYKVLIVDDRELFLLELKRLKVWGEISGFVIKDQAANGKEALDLLNQSPYDLVLTDIRMPVIDGLQLLREIKKNNLCPCIVILSEYSEFSYARQGIILGAFDYLVKPPTEESMFKLFKRVRPFLDSLKGNELSLPFPPGHTEGKSSEWAYPLVEEKQIINLFLKKDDSAVKLFRITLENLYTVLTDNIIAADIIGKKLYHNIITSVYDKFAWLGNFIDIHFFESVDSINEGRNEEKHDTFIDFYCRKIAFLLDLLQRFQPDTTDDSIRNICEYILNNSEEDLKLKVIAEKFYLNNTYLSNTFAAKTHIHFNNYVTMVKMARAKYLFLNTELKTYEVAYRIGYRDINYFSKLFKKKYGKSPGEYQSTAYDNYQI
jgi:two-component system response regulator YesN